MLVFLYLEKKKMSVLKLMEWRYATKIFDPEKIVPQEDIEYLKKCIRLTPSSYGLQPYKIQIITDADTKKKLLPYSYNQRQVVEASHLFVFANFTEISDEYLEYFYRLKAKVQGKKFEDYIPYMKKVSAFIKSLSPEKLLEYTALQTYMALETLLIAAPEKQIDTCAIGGFMPDKYNEILGYPQKNLNACVVAAVGYRSPEDQNQYLPKFRIPEEDLFF